MAGPRELELGELESVELGAPCRVKEPRPDGETRSRAGRCHLVAPNVLELRTTEPPAPGVEGATPARFGLYPQDDLTLRIAELGVPGEPRTHTRRLPLKVSGRLTREEVLEARLSFSGSIDACLDAYDGPPAEGFVVVQFVVGANGRPGNAGIRSSSLGIAGVEECLRTATAGWRFPPKETVTNVAIPIEVSLR